MAYKILQHRRGTSQEWLTTSLIPYEGEIVIEECLDGTCQFKIGDGKHHFSDLPYTTDSLKLELITKIIELDAFVRKANQELAQAFNKNINNLVL